MNKFPISPLFIPANKLEWIAKTFEKGADSIILDLEDSVPANEKAKAREDLFLHLKENSYEGNLIIRVNPVTDKTGQEDLKILTETDLPISAFMLPKVEESSSISDLPNINVIALLETPLSIKNISGIASENKVKGFGFGADDYLTKPFHKDELVARISAIIRRSRGHAQSIITTGRLEVNLDSKTVEMNNKRVHLTGKEYQMLELLSLRKGTTLTKEMFLNHLYGGMDEPELKIIDVFICKLRKKLMQASDNENYIETVWGRGYVLRDPTELLESA